MPIDHETPHPLTSGDNITAETGFEQAEISPEKKEKIQQFIDRLGHFLDFYSEEVPDERITHDVQKFPDYPNYKVQETYVLKVRDFFQEIKDSGVLSDNSYLDDSINFINQSILDKTALSYKGAEGAIIQSLPKDVQAKLLLELQKGMSSDEIVAVINQSLAGYPSERKMEIIFGIINDRPQTRIPVQGKMPEDIVEFARAKKDLLNKRLIDVEYLLSKEINPASKTKYDTDDDERVGSTWTL